MFDLSSLTGARQRDILRRQPLIVSRRDRRSACDDLRVSSDRAFDHVCILPDHQPSARARVNSRLKSLVSIAPIASIRPAR